MNTVTKSNAMAPEGTRFVGAEIRALRRAREMTLNELADASGVSVSHVSAIERGTVNPSLQKIESIALALAVPAAWFFTNRTGDGPLEQDYVVRAENRRNLNMVYGEPPEVSGYSDWLLSSSIGGDFYMGVSEFPPRSGPDPQHLYTRDGEQHLVVIEGELTLFLETEQIVLRAGDSYAIPGVLPHHVCNRSEAIARAIWVNAPVILPLEGVSRDGSSQTGNLKRVDAQAADA